MKARKVKGLEPEGTLADNAERIVRIRARRAAVVHPPRALDPSEVVALHDMRIAAKRLRYILEVDGRDLLRAVRRDGASSARKDLQDLLGEIHDCDVQLPRVLERLEELRAADDAHPPACAPRPTPSDLDPKFATRDAGARRLARPRDARRLSPGAARAALPALSRDVDAPRTRRVPRPPSVRRERAGGRRS